MIIICKIEAYTSGNPNCNSLQSVKSSGAESLSNPTVVRMSGRLACVVFIISGIPNRTKTTKRTLKQDAFWKIFHLG